MDSKTLLGFLQALAALGWPFVIYLFLRNFAAPIRDLLLSFNEIIQERGVKFSGKQLEILPPQEPEAISDFFSNSHHFKDLINQEGPEDLAQPLQAQQESEKNDILQEHEDTLVNSISSSIRGFLKKKAKEENAQNPQLWLGQLLCDSYICLYFERVFQRILGSQLILLTSLLRQKDRSLTLDRSVNLFERHVKAQEQEQKSFQDWLDYLEKSQLVRTKDQKIFLTKEGEEFLHYVGERGYPLKKLG